MTADERNKMEVLQHDLDVASRDDRKLRELLFVRHGCSGEALYGDDGELQCKSCFIDFARMLPDEIEQRFTELGLQQLVKLCKACGGLKRLGDAPCPTCQEGR